ncbi:MAG TPA: peptide deformylase [Verrucomicrobiae bacterium]|nr:peptide deformylase [Verrucomicrobiae bacterium]
MILEVVKYGNPVLRQKGAKIEKLTPEIKKLIADMFETMRERHGVGLAAQQIGKALQLTVIDVSEVDDRPSTLELDGKPADPKEIMPLVLINPEIKPHGDPIKSGEGCLSFPEIYAEISRPGLVDVKALDKNFELIEFRAGGLLSRAVQHEVDHLNGILFIDRMDKKTKEELRPELEVMQTETKTALEKRKK